MTPTSLPVPGTPVAAGPTAAASATTGQPTDFLLMLAQLAASSAPQAAAGVVAPPPPGGSATSEMPQPQAPDPQDVLALLSLGPPAWPIPLPAPARVAGAAEGELAQTAPLLGIAESAQNACLEQSAELQWSTTSEAAPTFDAAVHGYEAVQMPAALREAGRQPPLMHQLELARPVHAPVGSTAWGDEIGARVLMMTEQGHHTASLRLSPEHLGPLEISIAIRDDKASVWFGAAHADTRAAIETALPRLREMLESQGLSLTDAGVFREPPRQQQALHAQGHAGGDPARDDESASRASPARLGLVDAYA